jgi:hypothetical protein
LTQKRNLKIMEYFKDKKDLDAWIVSVGGLESIYNRAYKIHENNHTQLREEGRHFEWLIGHASLRLSMDIFNKAVEWWADWNETDTLHPINQIASLLSDQRIEPYKGKVTYFGYGEDCGDDVQKNYKDWLT